MSFAETPHTVRTMPEVEAKIQQQEEHMLKVQRGEKKKN